MIAETRRLLGRAADTRRRWGTIGLAREALNRAMTRVGSTNLLHVVLLEPHRVRAPMADSCFEMRFLTPDEIRRFASKPINRLPLEFADRAACGLDLCFAAIHGDRLASYAWYALHSVESEHCAGAALQLPRGMTYMYKAFTHPDFRGQRLYGACVGSALRALGDRGVDRLLSFVYWSNTASLRSSDLLGFRRLGLLLVGPGGPTRVPPQARRLGVRFGDEAEVTPRMPAPAAARAYAADGPRWRGSG